MSDNRLRQCSVCGERTFADCPIHGEEGLEFPSSSVAKCESGHDMKLLSEGYGYCEQDNYCYLWRLNDKDPYHQTEHTMVFKFGYCDWHEQHIEEGSPCMWAIVGRADALKRLEELWLHYEDEARVKTLRPAIQIGAGES